MIAISIDLLRLVSWVKSYLSDCCCVDLITLRCESRGIMRLEVSYAALIGYFFSFNQFWRPAMPKYQFDDNGILVDNDKPKSIVTTAPTTIVSRMSDFTDLSQVPAACAPKPLIPAETRVAINTFQGDSYLDKFQSAAVKSDDDLLDKLTAHFATFEMPLGAITPVTWLQDYDQLTHVVDDSGSMRSNTDVLFKELQPWLKQRLGQRDPESNVTRWEEALNRILVTLDIHAYIPVPIKITFLNRPIELLFEHKGKTIDQFVEDAKSLLFQEFSNRPSGYTPTFNKLSAVFSTPKKEMIYFYTDGVPTNSVGEDVDNQIQLVRNLIIKRNSALKPIILNSCTDQDQEVEWMKGLDKEAVNVGEIDSYEDEEREIRQNQGLVFAFNKALWILSSLVCADLRCRDTLDAMDEKEPLCHQNYARILGRNLSLPEYERYLSHHPQAKVYLPHLQTLYNDLLTTQQVRHVGTMPTSNPAALGLSMFANAGAMPPTQATATLQQPFQAL